MHLLSLLSLPPAILLLLCSTASAADPQWPHNVPKHLKYFPEDEVHAKRALNIREKLQFEKPVGVKKMSVDEGEMFMLDNWIFASNLERRRNYDNDTCKAQSPLRPLAEDDFFSRMRIRAALSKRQFACPAGTNSCSSIGAPDVCCGTGSTCINVNDSPGVGTVGCCPQGQRCAGGISCDTSSGYSACPDAPNGGCCLPGFRCAGIGCAAIGTSITYVQPSSSPPPPPSSTAVVIVPTSTRVPPTPTPSSAASYVCSTGWFTCAASLGGGCCQNGRTCATGASCLGDAPSSTVAPSAPVRPTSGSATPPASPSNDVCPTGFYVCSAYYPSGCCRVGRDCQTTGSCGLPTSTILNSNGVVIVGPTGLGVATTAAPQGGSCPSAWYSCPANRGGNCCPNNYECGEQCTATASGQSGVSQKVAPSTASFVSALTTWGMIMAAFSAGVAMIIL
ncbi:hypothetical protein CC86DRAFT_400181 [Ophiobolus disseminans]|uniref:GPI anchored protein n=1 Tax=Ophiobolus disseminans TaxID=1469910 RepID=A0A6A7ALE8_9PLEO|nr:hypothetical protein CC86DRAFT_400181 [Ophiobolus disseminans]